MNTYFHQPKKKHVHGIMGIEGLSPPHQKNATNPRNQELITGLLTTLIITETKVRGPRRNFHLEGWALRCPWKKKKGESYPWHWKIPHVLIVKSPFQTQTMRLSKGEITPKFYQATFKILKILLGWEKWYSQLLPTPFRNEPCEPENPRLGHIGPFRLDASFFFGTSRFFLTPLRFKPRKRNVGQWTDFCKTPMFLDDEHASTHIQGKWRKSTKPSRDKKHPRSDDFGAGSSPKSCRRKRVYPAFKINTVLSLFFDDGK